MKEPPLQVANTGGRADEKTPLLPASAPAGWSGNDQHEAVAFKAVRAVVVGVAFMAASASMILFNKTLMHRDRFPFPAFLASLHMIGSLTLALCLRAAVPSLFPSFDSVLGRGRSSKKGVDEEAAKDEEAPRPGLAAALAPFVPIAFCFALSLVAGNAAYRFATVTFLQTIKEGQLGLMYMMSVFFGIETLNLRNVLVLSWIAGSAVFAVYHQTQTSIVGFSLQMICGLGTATQAAMMNRLMSKRSGGRVDPMTTVLCMAPVTFLVLLPVNVAFWDHSIPERLHANALVIGCNMLLAFALQVVSAVTIFALNSVGQGVVSTLKDILIVFAASVALHEHITSLQALGFACAVAGVGLYSGMKLFPGFFEGRPKAPGKL